jgi:UDP-N-acetylglucosamine 4,6-dehydratase
LKGQRILVTGGSGTFGRAFIQYALHAGVERIVAVSRNSEQRYRLQREFPDPRLLVAPGDVRILSDLHRVCEVAGAIDILIHAAAEKHVSTGQQFRDYVYDVNVGGAIHVLELADARRIGRVVALSTDKACDPVNYYGETKAIAEGLFVAAGATVVRYGNVAGSSGSVMPLFIQQRAQGRITVTDLRMTRFFMPITDAPFATWSVIQEPGAQPVMSAVGLVRYAIEHGRPGDILVPTIPSGTIEDLAAQIGPGCEVVEVGIRDGEKIHERLIADAELPRTYRLTDGVYVIRPGAERHLRSVFETDPGFRYTSDANPQRLRVEAVAA